MVHRTGVAVLAAALALGAAACTSDGGEDDVPSAAASSALVEDVEATSGDDVGETLPALVTSAAGWDGQLPPELAGPVLDALVAHPDSLRAAWGPPVPGEESPSAELDDDALHDALVAAGADPEQAAAFRTSYLDYLQAGLTRSIDRAAPTVATWPDVLLQLDSGWLEPSAQVIGSVEAGCRIKECFDRVSEAMAEAQTAVDAVTYAEMPDGLVPASMVRSGERVPMSAWTVRMRDDWTRLKDSTPLPEIADKVEGAAVADHQGSTA